MRVTLSPDHKYIVNIEGESGGFLGIGENAVEEGRIYRVLRSS